MKKKQSIVIEQETAFFKWLAPQMEDKQLSNIHSIISTINDYGKRRIWIEKSLFELADSEHAQQFQKMAQEDKHFLFVHYGNVSQILLVLQKYCEYLEEKDKMDILNKTESEDIDDSYTSKESISVKLSSRGWSKYEVALLIETYLKHLENSPQDKVKLLIPHIEM